MVSKIVEGISVDEQLRIRDQGDDIPVQHIPELFHVMTMGSLPQLF